MKEVHLSVMEIAHTDRPLETIYKAARQCYARGSVVDMEPVSYDKMAGLVRRCISSGHMSVLEHVSFTFAISGVSRALSHQLVRHRIASYSQQSQRFVKSGEIEYVCPPSLKDETSAEREFFIEGMKTVEHAYRILLDSVPAEDARFILPNATATNIVMTMNCRELLHFIEERCCPKSQWEIYGLAWKIRDCLDVIFPEVFETAGPKCWRMGYCPEGKGCGAYPQKTA